VPACPAHKLSGSANLALWRTTAPSINTSTFKDVPVCSLSAPGTLEMHGEALEMRDRLSRKSVPRTPKIKNPEPFPQSVQRHTMRRAVSRLPRSSYSPLLVPPCLSPLTSAPYRNSKPDMFGPHAHSPALRNKNCGIWQDFDMLRHAAGACW
jgi:hypothetical protein